MEASIMVTLEFDEELGKPKIKTQVGGSACDIACMYAALSALITKLVEPKVLSTALKLHEEGTYEATTVHVNLGNIENYGKY